MKTRVLIGFFLSISWLAVSQNKQVVLHGTVLCKNKSVANAHILNNRTALGTISDKNGLFSLRVSLHDTLQISSIQHEKAFVVITTVPFKNKNITVALTTKTYLLDEVLLKNHDLSGRLSSDVHQTPQDKRATALGKTMTFTTGEFSGELKDDYIDAKVRPPSNNTDPTSAFQGAGATVSMPFKYSERLWALRKKLNKSAALPAKLLGYFGADFFFKELKIPEVSYHHFISYCTGVGLEELYDSHKILELIVLLKTEAISYLKIIETVKYQHK